MGREEVKRNLLSDQVAGRIEASILSGSFEPGGSLPSEAELTEQFGVSRAVIRDATRFLAARGLVEVRQGRRPTVLGLSAIMPRHFFGMVLSSDKDALLELVEVRRSLEVTNARLAAASATEDDVRKMQGAIDEMKALLRDSVGSTPRDPAAYDEADLGFHEGLAAATGNRFLRLLIEALGEPLRASRVESRHGHSLRGLRPLQSVEAHQKILDAVSAGHSEAAGREMEAHLASALEDLNAASGEITRTEADARGIED